jgi:hypothetical protein
MRAKMAQQIIMKDNTYSKSLYYTDIPDDK